MLKTIRTGGILTVDLGAEFVLSAVMVVPRQIVLGIWAIGISWDLEGTGGTGSCVKLVV